MFWISISGGTCGKFDEINMTSGKSYVMIRIIFSVISTSCTASKPTRRILDVSSAMAPSKNRHFLPFLTGDIATTAPCMLAVVAGPFTSELYCRLGDFFSPCDRLASQRVTKMTQRQSGMN